MMLILCLLLLLETLRCIVVNTAYISLVDFPTMWGAKWSFTKSIRIPFSLATLFLCATIKVASNGATEVPSTISQRSISSNNICNRHVVPWDVPGYLRNYAKAPQEPRLKLSLEAMLVYKILWEFLGPLSLYLSTLGQFQITWLKPSTSRDILPCAFRHLEFQRKG